MSLKTFLDGKNYPKSLVVERAPYMPAGSRFKVTEIETHPCGNTYYSLSGPQIGYFPTRKAALQAIAQATE